MEGPPDVLYVIVSLETSCLWVGGPGCPKKLRYVTLRRGLFEAQWPHCRLPWAGAWRCRRTGPGPTILGRQALLGCRKKCAAPCTRWLSPAPGCDGHFSASACCVGTGLTYADCVCLSHARAQVLAGSAADVSNTVILTSISVITIMARIEITCSTASATACPR